MRKLFVLFLLTAVCAILFSPSLSKNTAFPGIISSQVHPSTLPLPEPWLGKPKIVLNRSQADSPEGGFPATGSTCGDTFILQDGDSLGEVAGACGISLADLLSVNQQIKNPNQVFAGQQIVIPDRPDTRGNEHLLSISASSSQAGGFQPGSRFTIDAANLPPKTKVRVGLGLSKSGYSVLSEAQTDADGKLSLTLSLPVHAQPGEVGFILVTTKGTPSVQMVSRIFTVGE